MNKFNPLFWEQKYVLEISNKILSYVTQQRDRNSLVNEI